LSGEDSFMQHKAGLLAKAAFDSYQAGVHFYMTNPGMRAAWQLSAGQFGAEFRHFVDSILRATTIKQVPHAYTEWKKLVQTGAGVPTTLGSVF
jgi:hypothetical protein